MVYSFGRITGYKRIVYLLHIGCGHVFLAVKSTYTTQNTHLGTHRQEGLGNLLGCCQGFKYYQHDTETLLFPYTHIMVTEVKLLKQQPSLVGQVGAYDQSHILIGILGSISTST